MEGDGKGDKNGDSTIGESGRPSATVQHLEGSEWSRVGKKGRKTRRNWVPFPTVNCFTRASEVQSLAAATEVTSRSHHIRHRHIQALVDSGAAAHVLPATILEDYPVADSNHKREVKYMTADGNELPDLGTKQVPFRTREGHDCGVKWQVADIKRPLY